ncbi:hypothetical protein AYO46_07465 [Betaproteobacteria bacterium SCGC AG-212-J23]|nr:hypothetical protein AYO46_07465 [Betaproteobacteria bacterium SCGC AG-212-J23]
MTTMTKEKAKSAKLRIASSRELVDVAKKALEKSNAKAEKGAVAILEDTHSAMFALEELAKNAQTLGFESYFVEVSCRHLCNAVCDNFDAARSALPKSHAARDFLKKATAAVHDLCYITEHFSRDSDADEVTRAAAGRAMLGFTSDAGRWMERAELALNSDSFFSGWLDFSHIQGMEGYTPREK